MKFSKLSASAEYNMFILKGNRCMDGRWTISPAYLRGRSGGVKCLKNPCPSLNALVRTSLACLPPSICTGDKVHLSILTSSAHWCQGTKGSEVAVPLRFLRARLLTDSLLRLTSHSTLLPWHFVGANSNFLCGLLDWNTKIKLRGEDSSFIHCAC